MTSFFRSMVATVAFAANAFAASNDKPCGGLPRLGVETPAGFCVGVVATGFKFPRSLVELPGGALLVADMGGWPENKGSVVRLTPKGGAYERETLFEKLDRPAQIRLGPEGNVYVGTVGAIFRFAPDRPKETWTKVIGDLPTTGLHPLRAFTFDGDGTLYLNVGSETDNCGEDAKAGTCKQLAAGRGVVKRYVADGKGGFKAGTVFARGLRNTMAMTFVDGALYAVENSRDRINKQDAKLSDEDLPHDELNVLREGKDYGWPYCFDAQRNAPEFPRYDCKKTEAPLALLPPHAAPLGLLRYRSDGAGAFPAAYRDLLVIGFHGYRKDGHRIVAMPLSADKTWDLVRGWTKERAGTQGAPVALTLAADGSLYVADDKNKRVLRLVYVAKEGDGAPLAAVTAAAAADAACTLKPSGDALTDQVQRDVFDGVCFECHGKGGVNAGRFKLTACDAAANLSMLRAPGPDGAPWVTPGKLDGVLARRVNGKKGLPQMPPGGMEAEKVALVERWIRSLR